MNLISSSSLSRDDLKAVSVFGGLYKLKNCSGHFSENACDSIATGASEQNTNEGRGALTPEVEVQIFDPIQILFVRPVSKFQEELIGYRC